MNELDFAAFWKHYPKKVGRPEAKDAYERLVDTGAKPHEILRALKRYRQLIDVGEIDHRLIKHAAVFLADWTRWA